MAVLHDISPRLHAATAVWPGDVSLHRHVALSIAGGDALELSSITTTVHIGAHADAPSHYGRGVHIADRDPALYVGPCEVFHLDVARGHRIVPADLPHPPTQPRVLLATGTAPDPDHFNEDFAALSVDLVEWLARHGVRLVGIDTPSVDLCHDAELLAHHAIERRDLAILEGLRLGTVPAGVYTLLAAPLPLEADASPVRALLLEQVIDDPLEPI